MSRLLLMLLILIAYMVMNMYVARLAYQYSYEYKRDCCDHQFNCFDDTSNPYPYLYAGRTSSVVISTFIVR